MPAASAASDEGELPFVFSAEELSGQNGSAGTLDLEATGGLDWVHLAGAETNRKVDGDLIEVENLNTDRAMGELGDSPYRYVWSNGTPTESNTAGVTTGGVFFHTGNNGGYEVTVPAGDSWRELILIGGAWQAEAELSVQASSESEPSYVEAVSAGEASEVNEYTVLIAPNEGVTFTVETESAGEEGNVSLAAATLSDVAEGSFAYSIETGEAPVAVNLTEKGDLDWIHVYGDEVNRKADVDETITVSNRSRKPIPTLGGDWSRTFSWSDGKPTATQDAYGKASVFKADAEYAETTDPRGFDIDLADSDKARTVTFYANTWNADVEMSLYVNGEEDAVATSTNLHDNPAPYGVTQVSFDVPADVSAKLEGQIVTARHEEANVVFAGAAVSEGDSRDDLTKLQELLAAANKANIFSTSEFNLNQLQSAIASTEELLAGDPSDAEIAVQLRILEVAYQMAANAGAYTDTTDPRLQASIGWEGDRHAPFAYIDGSYKLRDRDNLMVRFGIPDIPGKIDWYNAEGYLPAFVSEFEKAGADVSITNFADKATINKNDYEIVYSRMTVTNNNDSEMTLPSVSDELVPLNEGAKQQTVAAGETVTMDYAIAADRFNGTYDWPAADEVKNLGSYDDAYDHMKNYWNDRLEPLVQISELPNEDLINAYKAGFIYTMIIRDDIDGEKRLHVGENSYDLMFDHDTIGIVATLLTSGDFKYAQEYLATLPAQLQYDDAKWKYSWPYALYLQRTGDTEFIKEKFETIKKNTHNVETDRIGDNHDGIMKETEAIDSTGYWTIDNWSALAGLTTYAWIAEQIGEDEEVEWATDQYDSLLDASNTQLDKLIDEYDLDYIPMSMTAPNDQLGDGRDDPRDANWASMFLFGRWGWDGYLFGAEQSGPMFDWIDQTYTHGFENREDITDTIYNFGGYPHGWFSSAYNAGYGSTALRGEQYRDAGIRGYEFMINESQSAPFGWWEGIDYPDEDSPWSINHAAGGGDGGSNQHMWGQSTNTKVLLDSLFALKTDGTAIIGRGVPTDWIADGEVIDIADYPVNIDGRIGYKMATNGNKVTVDFSGDTDKVDQFSIELMALRNNICAVEGKGAEYDFEAGTVTVPSATQKVVITMGADCENPTDPTDPPTDEPTDGPTNGPTDGPTGGSSDGPTDGSTNGSDNNNGSLPFTGFSGLLLALLAALLLAGGVLFVRRSADLRS